MSEKKRKLDQLSVQIAIEQESYADLFHHIQETNSTTIQIDPQVDEIRQRIRQLEEESKSIRKMLADEVKKNNLSSAPTIESHKNQLSMIYTELAKLHNKLRVEKKVDIVLDKDQIKEIIEVLENRILIAEQEYKIQQQQQIDLDNIILFDQDFTNYGEMLLMLKSQLQSMNDALNSKSQTVIDQSKKQRLINHADLDHKHIENLREMIETVNEYKSIVEKTTNSEEKVRNMTILEDQIREYKNKITQLKLKLATDGFLLPGGDQRVENLSRSLVSISTV